jgi:hypothetical protein
LKGIITICGSTKFKKEFEAANAALSFKGYAIFTVGSFGHSLKTKELRDHTANNKPYLDDLYKQKIDLSFAIFVINKDGYIGESTASEISHATEGRKKIYYLSDQWDDVPTSQKLFNDVDRKLFVDMMKEET